MKIAHAKLDRLFDTKQRREEFSMVIGITSTQTHSRYYYVLLNC